MPLEMLWQYGWLPEGAWLKEDCPNICLWRRTQHDTHRELARGSSMLSTAISLAIWTIIGWPTSKSLGYLYSRHWDGATYLSVLVAAVIVSLPFLVLGLCYHVVSGWLTAQRPVVKPRKDAA
jgi:hypothetical protein